MTEYNEGFRDLDAALDDVVAADTAPHRGDLDRVERALATLARSGSLFNADSVSRLVEHENDAPFNRLLLGAAMHHWARTGMIAPVWDLPPAPSVRRIRHGSRLQWWRGTAAARRAAA